MAVPEAYGDSRAFFRATADLHQKHVQAAAQRKEQASQQPKTTKEVEPDGR